MFAAGQFLSRGRSAAACSLAATTTTRGRIVMSSALKLQQLPLQQQQQIQVRWNWQAVIRRRLDRKEGGVKYEDWDVVARNFREPALLDGTPLLQRHLNQQHHVKPTERNRRINSAKVYRRSVKRIEDLTKYIQFVRERGGTGIPKK